MNETTDRLHKIRHLCFQDLIEMYYRAKAGHIGSSLSCLEILVTILGHEAKGEDICILSKGHAAGALYVALAHTGRLDVNSLDTFYQNGTLLAAHPPCSGEIEAIPFGTGSLGHGLALAAGLAFAQKYKIKKKNFFAVLSDGECNEGSTWEAALFASHHRLTNLTVIVDANGLQGLGNCSDIMNLEPFKAKWESMGFDTREVTNGNDFHELLTAFAVPRDTRPVCILARTTKGHGVEFMQNQFEWHYRSLSEQQYASIPNRKPSGK